MRTFFIRLFNSTIPIHRKVEEEELFKYLKLPYTNEASAQHNIQFFNDIVMFLPPEQLDGRDLNGDTLLMTALKNYHPAMNKAIEMLVQRGALLDQDTLTYARTHQLNKALPYLETLEKKIIQSKMPASASPSEVEAVSNLLNFSHRAASNQENIHHNNHHNTLKI